MTEQDNRYRDRAPVRAERLGESLRQVFTPPPKVPDEFAELLGLLV
jgi:hypothetical protein